MMRYVVTRDQRVEHTLGMDDIAIWDEKAFDSLKMDSDGQWSAGDKSVGLIDEMRAHAFEKEYGIVPPKAGSKGYLKATYEWE
jgi:hypothetical protein